MKGICLETDLYQYTCVSHSAMSDSLQAHGLQPATLLCPWNSPGKNTGMGCHFLLQGIFPTQGLNPGLLCCRQILLPLSHQRSLYQYNCLTITPIKRGIKCLFITEAIPVRHRISLKIMKNNNFWPCFRHFKLESRQTLCSLLNIINTFSSCFYFCASYEMYP